MSTLFGPFVQQGYIVPDLDAGVAHWAARGIGPFLVIPSVRIAGAHYGRGTMTHITAAFAMSGDQQIELIQPHEDTGPNIYSDYLAEHPQGGMQHLAAWSDDVEGDLARITEAGVDYVLAQRHYGTHAYIDLMDSPGVMIQLMPTHQRYLDLFEKAAQAAVDWDGSDPARPVDWD